MTDAMKIHDHFLNLFNVIRKTEISDHKGDTIGGIAQAHDMAIKSFQTAAKEGNKIIFIGNGGSAAIASHAAIDYSNAGKLRAITLGDSAAITCAANDYGYENGYKTLLEMYADAGDILVAISSSGGSPNIINAVNIAITRHLFVITFSGFKSSNPLRKLGDLNFYTPSMKYGTVEVAHMALIHSILDLMIEGKNV